MTLSPELQSWLGRSRVLEEDVGLGMTRRIAAMLDLDPMGFRLGDELPSPWFAMYFTEAARQSALGPDGHPAPGVFLPPIPLPRRMGAGRRVTLHGPMRVGEMLSKTIEVAAIEPKQARTGFITGIPFGAATPCWPWTSSMPCTARRCARARKAPSTPR